MTAVAQPLPTHSAAWGLLKATSPLPQAQTLHDLEGRASVGIGVSVGALFSVPTSFSLPRESGQWDARRAGQRALSCKYRGTPSEFL